jgi:hypothetical protein
MKFLRRQNLNSSNVFDRTILQSTDGNIEFNPTERIAIGVGSLVPNTLEFGSLINDNTFIINSTINGTINLETTVTTGTVNQWQTVTGRINVGRSGIIQLGTGTSASTTTIIGGAVTGNTLKISSTENGTINLTTDVESGTVNIFNSVLTDGVVNFATGSEVTVNIGGTDSQTNIEELKLTKDLAVEYGGTGASTFIVNGVIYGNATDSLQVTAASNPGSNAETSYGILTTNENNVPVWTDVIDGGSY